MGASFRETPGNHVVDALQVGRDFVIPEPQHLQSFAVEEKIARRVGGAVQMLAAVGFDHQPRFQAGEVDDVGTDGVLPAEAVAVDLAVPQE